MADIFAFVVDIGATILCVYIAQRLARRRGRSSRGWMWGTAIFGVFALVVLALLPAKRGFKNERFA